MKTAYFNCIGGVSGDMVLGALVDVGLPIDSLRNELSKLGIDGYEIEACSDVRAAISGTRVSVTTTRGVQPRRNLEDITSLINESRLKPVVKDKAIKTFGRLAQAESRVHRVPVDQIHFHEVGAVDAIVDIVGAACGLDMLGIEQVHCSPVPPGSGTVWSEHGRLPVPAPATVELMALAKAPFAAASPHAPATELSTPTGVALMTSLSEFAQPDMRVDAAGYGIGQKDMGEYPNVLALWLGEVDSGPGARRLIVIETNIDDMNPEIYPYIMDRLLESGARDVWFTPIHMKKGRPAVMVSVLADPGHREAVVSNLFRETTTLGVRVREVFRYEAERRIERVDTSIGPVRVKLKIQDSKPVSVSPEHDDCATIAAESGLPLRDVYRIVTEEASNFLLRYPESSPDSGQ